MKLRPLLPALHIGPVSIASAANQSFGERAERLGDGRCFRGLVSGATNLTLTRCPVWLIPYPLYRWAMQPLRIRAGILGAKPGILKAVAVF